MPDPEDPEPAAADPAVGENADGDDGADVEGHLMRNRGPAITSSPFDMPMVEPFDGDNSNEPVLSVSWPRGGWDGNSNEPVLSVSWPGGGWDANSNEPLLHDDRR